MFTYCCVLNLSGLFSPRVPPQYARLKQYQVFRLVFLLYLLLPTCFLIFEVSSAATRGSMCHPLWRIYTSQTLAQFEQFFSYLPLIVFLLSCLRVL